LRDLPARERILVPIPKAATTRRVAAAGMMALAMPGESAVPIRNVRF
jgi:hypothetical protein